MVGAVFGCHCECMLLIVIAVSGVVLPTAKCANSYARIHSHCQVC